MNNIYNETLEAVKNEISVCVDIVNQNLIINGKKIIDGGKYEGDLGLPKVASDIALEKIEEAYIEYKNSSPISMSETKRQKCLFKTIDSKYISDEFLMFNESQDIAQCRLELTFLIYILNKSLSGEDEPFKDKWYWQSPKDKDLIILKKWIIN